MGVERAAGLVTAVVAAALLLGAGTVFAQSTAATPQTGEMIEALKPPLTRGSRNLIVRQKPDEVAAPAPAPAPPPSPAPTAQPTSLSTAAPAPTPTPTTPAAEPPPSLSLAIQFDTNSARVRPESGALLGNLVAALQSPDLKANRFLIEGHTDASGNAAANQRLSQQRADEVRLYLVALGVHPARLRAVGKGSSDPADPLNPLSAENRRVRVVTQP